MSSDLRGVRIACFYPWNPFEPTGSWTRFSCLWRFLLQEGAQVTLAFLDKGEEVSFKNLSVRYLGEHNVINKIGALARSLVSGEAKSELKDYSTNELNFLLMYEKGLYLRSPATAVWLESILQGQDIVTCDYPMYLPFLSEFCRKAKLPLIATSHDMLFELHGTHPGAKQRLKQNEVQALHLADGLVFCNESERMAFQSLGLKGVTVLNTGDALNITPGRESESRAAVRTALKIKEPEYCLFVGSAHGPNAEAAREVRRMAKTMPECAFVVVGNCCAKVSEENFVATGHVTEALLDLLYRGAFAVIVPLIHGTGMSVKVFQALVYGKAVVSTLVGARGYTFTEGKELLIAATPLEFPAVLRRLRADEPLRSAVGKWAREYALGLDYRTHFRPYATMINQLLGRTPVAAEVDRRSLILVDNNLSDRVGHHFNYALALKKECAELGVSFVALTNRTAAGEVNAALNGFGVFGTGIHEGNATNPFPAEWGSIRSTYDFLQSNDHFARELEAGLAGRVALNDCVFLPNATPRQLLGVALLLLRSPLYQMLNFVLVLRYSVYAASGPIAERKITLDKETAERYALSLEKLIGADSLSRVRLATDSEELAKEYGAFCRRPIVVLPIPHTRPVVAGEASLDFPAKLPGKIRLIYLGDARDEKGFELLAGAVRACLKTPQANVVEFVFQAFISSHYHQKMIPAIEELTRLKLPCLHLITRSLSSEAYETLLLSADLVLLPYDALTYRARTSGPFVEAICADKPVVVPKASWMSAQLKDSRAGETFVSGNLQDFGRAVQTVLANLPLYTAAARELGKQFREFHNPRNFISQLMQSEQSPHRPKAEAGNIS